MNILVRKQYVLCLFQKSSNTWNHEQTEKAKGTYGCGICQHKLKPRLPFGIRICLMDFNDYCLLKKFSNLAINDLNDLVTETCVRLHDLTVYDFAYASPQPQDTRSVRCALFTLRNIMLDYNIWESCVFIAKRYQLRHFWIS